METTNQKQPIMKHKIYRFLLFAGLVLLSAFTLVPPVHQVAEGHKYIPEMVLELPPVDSLTLAVGDAGGAPGEQVCVPILTYDFQNILSMQFSVSWDTTALRFTHVGGFGMRDISDNNFGKSMTDKGHLAFLWYDQHLLGKSHPDGFKLYDICFDIVGEEGTSTQVEITDHPTVGEVVNASAVFLGLHTEVGKIDING